MYLYRLFCLMLVATAGLAVCHADGIKVVNTEQAIARTKTFLHDAGWKIAGKAKVSSVKSGLSTTWTVTYAVEKDGLKTPGITVSVDSAGGQVHHAMNAMAVEKIPRKIARPITKAAAEKAARKFLQAAGISTTDLVVRTNELCRVRPNSSRWTVVFRRVQQGYEYLFDYLSVDLDPRNGSLLILSIMPPSTPPKSVQVVVTKDEAAGYARKALAQRKPSLKSNLSYSAQVWIVPPFDGKVKAGPSRAAWVVTFSEPSKDGKSVFPAAETWIDAEKGTVLYLHAFPAAKPPKKKS